MIHKMLDTKPLCHPVLGLYLIKCESSWLVTKNERVEFCWLTTNVSVTLQ